LGEQANALSLSHSYFTLVILKLLVASILRYISKLMNETDIWYLYTVSPKKTCDYIFYNNFNNRCPITIIFGTVSGKSMCHRKMVSIPTSPI